MTKRIMIIGSGGAGKSTLARAMGEKLSRQVIHLDVLLWKPNWNLVPREEQVKIQEQIVQDEEWIIDGNYGGTMDIRLQEADTIVFIDISRVICTYRAIKRSIQYRNKPRPDMVEGNKEKFDFTFYKWIWNYPKEVRPEIIKKLEELEDEKQIIHLKSLKEIQNFIERL